MEKQWGLDAADVGLRGFKSCHLHCPGRLDFFHQWCWLRFSLADAACCCRIPDGRTQVGAAVVVTRWRHEFESRRVDTSVIKLSNNAWSCFGMWSPLMRRLGDATKEVVVILLFPRWEDGQMMGLVMSVGPFGP